MRSITLQDDASICIKAMLDDNQQYRITVTDTGEGLPVGMEAQIFERFTRGNSESTTTGLGLGLALSRDLVEHLGGTLSANNVQPHGAQFIITLPWQLLPEQNLLSDDFISSSPNVNSGVSLGKF